MPFEEIKVQAYEKLEHNLISEGKATELWQKELY
jgi:hypothetical protein